MSPEKSHHTEWLELVEVSGPFLSPPVLQRAFPQGLDALDSDHAAKLRFAREEWVEEQDKPDPDPEIHDQWIRFVLTETLEYSPEVLQDGDAIPEDVIVEIEEHRTTLRPDFVLADPDTRKARLLIHVHPPAQDLTAPIPDAPWAAHPATRMTQHLRVSGVRVGLVTNGERWMLVDAREGENAGYVSWYSWLWSAEPLTLRAFRSLLGLQRFFGVDESETLEALLWESATFQAEVTEQLGAQVRSAVETLVQSLDRADADTGRKLLRDVTEADLYEAAITVMMRLVFLFFAEENDLVPLSDDLYQQHYAASTIREQLAEERDRVGVEVLEKRQDAWNRLLATFRVIYGGIDHDQLHLPAYGGSLFDPDRFPFIEGRIFGTTWRETEADPLPIDNRTVLHLLDALQLLRGKRGKEDARKLSFRALDIEQIGHVYEMLLDHTIVRAAAPTLGLQGAKNTEPEVPLGEIEEYAERSEDALVQFLGERTRKSAKSIRNALAKEPSPEWEEKVRLACGNDDKLLERVVPYQALLRTNPWGDPIVFHKGSLYVTLGTERRATGTYYTPRALTEEIVTHALEPLVYRGPAEGKARDEWELKEPPGLLDLKVCDPAMGSGAFLVQVVRYLSERLVEAWEQVEERLSGPITTEGELSMGSPSELLVPRNPEERITLAMRLVADRSVYGVDVNPLAVEMAKLSLWLITLAKGKPFSFLDHALKGGDSLLGVHDLDQIRYFHPDPDRGRTLHSTLFDPITHIDRGIEHALELRQELKSFPVRHIRDAEHKEELNRKSEEAINKLRLLGDLLIGARLASTPKDDAGLDDVLHQLADSLPPIMDFPAPDERLQAEAQVMLNEGKGPMKPDRRPLHWPVEFPEIFRGDRVGFDAVVSNPPFMGGVDIASNFGVPYERYLKVRVPESKGFVDLAAYFHRRVTEIAADGVVVLLGPQNLRTTANRRAAMEPILRSGRRIAWARSRVAWPGTAAVEVCIVSYCPSDWNVNPELDGSIVSMINASLEATVDASSAHRLRPWLSYSQGTDLYGSAFVKRQKEWEPFLAREPNLSKYLRPYVNAKILCTMPDFRSDLLVVDFGEREKEELRDVSHAVSHLEREVTSERAAQTRQVHEHRPWLFWDKRTKAYRQARRLDRVLVCPNLSKHLPMVFVDSGYLLSKGVKFFITEDFAVLGLLQSTPFIAWAQATSTMRGGSLAFSTRNSLDTFVPPDSLEALRAIAQKYSEARMSVMRKRECSITDLLNRFHNPDEKSGDVLALQRLHGELDTAVATAYGWADLDFDLGFYDTPQGIRYTLQPAVRAEVLIRLLELNDKLYAAAVGGQGRLTV